MNKVKSHKSTKSEMIDEDREPIEMGDICQQNDDFLNFDHIIDPREYEDNYERSNVI